MLSVLRVALFQYDLDLGHARHSLSNQGSSESILD
jgi:hypothetical protein